MSVHTAQSTPCRAAGRCFVPAAHARRMSVSVAGHHAVVPSLAARPAAFLPAPASAHTLQQRRSVAARATLEGGDKDWYKKNLEVWTEIKSKADFDAIVTKNTPGKYKFVEFYASTHPSHIVPDVSGCLSLVFVIAETLGAPVRLAYLP